ncbi:MAG TPA: hypothetical protein VFU29_01850 [Chitinophagaceae bacterium]|nr:hypothetical protein [Chitinophagaceae bacterium]
MRRFIILLSIGILIANSSHSQGCIMVRNISGFGQYNFIDNGFSSSNWYVNITSRYFRSYHDFKGTTALSFPKDSIQTIHSFTTDITISRLLANGWSFSLSVPLNANSRTSKLEHGGISNPPHTTHTFGIGDMRFTAYKWLLTPKAHQKINIQLGLGIKLPTGDYKYQDYFYRKEDSAVLAPVNPSIQLGDGGTGIILEMNTFYVLSTNISFYGNIYYLLNPRDQNGTSNLLGRKPTTPAQINLVKALGDVNSVPDQYSLRAGIDLKLEKWLLSIGLRHEGIPVYDLIGESNGFRKAGYNTSIEPGIVYSKKNSSIYFYFPVVVATKIKQSVPDKKESNNTGVFVWKQGNSTDFFILAGFQLRF